MKISPSTVLDELCMLGLYIIDVFWESFRKTSLPAGTHGPVQLKEQLGMKIHKNALKQNDGRKERQLNYSVHLLYM